MLRRMQKLEAYTNKAFAPLEVLQIKELIHASGLQLRLPRAAKQGAGLASPSGYNAMNWTRCFSLLMRDLYGADKIHFSQKMWKTMLRCQGGHRASEALSFCGIESASAANSHLAECQDLTWELLVVALCESRHAWQHFNDGGKEFSRIVAYVSVHPQCSKTIRRFTHLISERGALHKHCFSTRLFRALYRHIACRAKTQARCRPKKERRQQT